MPTYTYKCKECGNQFDARQKFSDNALTDCPECEGRLRRLVNNSGGIVFKGSGFYINDSKAGGKKKSSATSSAASKSSENGESVKSETASSNEGAEKKSSDKPKEKSSTPSLES